MRVTFRKVTLRRREICRRSVKFWNLIFDWLLFSYRPLDADLSEKKREKKVKKKRRKKDISLVVVCLLVQLEVLNFSSPSLTIRFLPPCPILEP